MMKKHALMGLLTSVLLSVGAAADDFTEISTVIQKYFDGTSKGNPELVTEAFLPSLELQYVDAEGKLGRWMGTDYIAGIERGQTNDRVGRLIAVDITGAAAMAKAEIVSGNTRFTDYFLLLKVKEGWRIANKTFVRESR